jgi:hypothetical protein
MEKLSAISYQLSAYRPAAVGDGFPLGYPLCPGLSTHLGALVKELTAES